MFRKWSLEFHGTASLKFQSARVNYNSNIKFCKEKKSSPTEKEKNKN